MTNTINEPSEKVKEILRKTYSSGKIKTRIATSDKDVLSFIYGITLKEAEFVLAAVRNSASR